MIWVADLVHNRLLKIVIDLLESECWFIDNVTPAYANSFLKFVCDKCQSCTGAGELIFPSRWRGGNHSDPGSLASRRDVGVRPGVLRRGWFCIRGDTRPCLAPVSTVTTGGAPSMWQVLLACAPAAKDGLAPKVNRANVQKPQLARIQIWLCVFRQLVCRKLLKLPRAESPHLPKERTPQPTSQGSGSLWKSDWRMPREHARPCLTHNMLRASWKLSARIIPCTSEQWQRLPEGLLTYLEVCSVSQHCNRIWVGKPITGFPKMATC